MSVEFDFEIDIEGHKIKASVSADGHVYGHNYGEDADGNRGEWRVELEDLEITVTDGRGKDITQKLKIKRPGIFEDIEEEAEGLLFENYHDSQGGREYENDDD